jgi:hypothetical protein
MAERSSSVAQLAATRHTANMASITRRRAGLVIEATYPL